METPDSVTRLRALIGGIAVLGAGGGVVYGASTLSGSEPAAGNETQAPPFHQSTKTQLDVDLSGTPIMGTPDATFTMFYWSEYQCPFCRQFEAETLPKLIENDVRPGRLRVAFLEFPYMGEASTTAAVMDRCVWRQVRDAEPGRYWQWRKTIFENQGDKNSGWASKENLLSLTDTVDGVDSSAVESCMSDHRSEIESKIDAEARRARRFRFRGTPSFVIADLEADAAGKLVGAQPYENFQKGMEQLANQ